MTSAMLERDFMRLNLQVHVVCTRMCCVVVKMVKELKLSLHVETIPKSSWRGFWLFRCCGFLIGEHQCYLHSKATTEE
jgi:hypothetical protein